jgi:hypothetical protein
MPPSTTSPARGQGAGILIAGIGKLDHSAQTGRHRNVDRGFDLYETPPVAIEALLAVENLPDIIWEPAAGRGAIVNVLRDLGHQVIASDIINYGFQLDSIADFLRTTTAPIGCNTVLTNPPYQIATEFAGHALDLAPEVYLLARLAFLESIKRTAVLEHRGLRAVHVFRKRLPMMHRHNWRGPRASSAIPFAWFCWSRGHRGSAIVDRIG